MQPGQVEKSVLNSSGRVSQLCRKEGEAQGCLRQLCFTKDN